MDAVSATIRLSLWRMSFVASFQAVLACASEACQSMTEADARAELWNARPPKKDKRVLKEIAAERAELASILKEIDNKRSELARLTAKIARKKKPRKPRSPDSLIHGVWTRIRNIAAQQGLSVEELAAKPDHELLRIEHLGRTCVAALASLRP
jgi:predicted DNA-binding ribbon-helix-helix protein